MMRRAAPDADLIVVTVACAVLAIVSNRLTGFDLWLSSLFHTAASGGFPLRREWLWSVVLHDGVKWLSVLIWVALLAAWGFLRLREFATTADLRAKIAFALWSALAAVLAVNLLRAQSAHSCPWYLTEFGGNARFFRLFDPQPADSGPGHCLPSGHASTAFMWFAVLPVLSGRIRRQALAGVLGLGALAGMVQVARGAHFISHILLAASACAAVVWLAACLVRRLAPEKVPALSGR